MISWISSITFSRNYVVKTFQKPHCHDIIRIFMLKIRNKSSCTSLKWFATYCIKNWTQENKVFLFVTTRISINLKIFIYFVTFRLWIINKFSLVFFFILDFFHKHSRFTGEQEKGDAISLISLYHVHPLYRNLDISRAISAESSPLYIASSQTWIGILWFLWFLSASC